MPQVEFARADLPWLFTPAAPAHGQTRLRPWLVLVAVRRRTACGSIARPGGPLPVLELGAPARGAASCPTSRSRGRGRTRRSRASRRRPSPAHDARRLDPGRACSRLRLPAPPASRAPPYLACLVPAFAAGVKAGLGEPVTLPTRRASRPAWGADARSGCGCRSTTRGSSRPGRPAASRRWCGACIRARSIRRRRSRRSSTSATPAAGCRVAAGPRRAIGMQSALRAPGPDAPPPWPDATRAPFQARARARCSRRAPDGHAHPAGLRAAAGRREALPPESAAAGVAARAQPRPAAARRRRGRHARRAGAPGAADGARVGAGRRVRDANALLRRSQLARELGGVAHERHLRAAGAVGAAGDDAAGARADRDRDATVDGELRASRVPEAVVSGAMRRLASPQGLLARRAGPSATQRGRSTCSPAVDRMAVAPPAAAPGGMVVMTLAVRRAAAGQRQRPALSAQSHPGAQLLERLAPENDGAGAHEARVAAPAGTWTRPDPLAPVATGPRFAEPMYDGPAARSRRGCSCRASRTSRRTASRCWRRRRA